MKLFFHSFWLGFLLLCAAFLLPGRLLAQDEPPAEDEPARARAPRVFLDCDRCDFSFIRREVPYVNYVRDPEAAQIHVLVTSRRTGSGGRAYTLEFIGREDLEDMDQRLRYVTQPSDTDAAERAGFVRKLQMGLMPYIAETPAASRISISYDEEGELRETPQAVDDPWHNWVFDLDAGASFDLESQQRELSYDGSVEANRITRMWRIRNRLDFEYDTDTFERIYEENGETVEETITSSSYDRDFSSSVVRSISRHWSAGVFGALNSDTQFNTALGGRLAPALEYSVFPYAQAERRELTFAYRAGIRPVQYMEETIFNRTEQVLLYQSLQARLRFTQPWGSAFASLQGSHYFHDFGRYSVDFFGIVSVRLFRGLSARVRAGAEAVHDQLYLEKGGATLEEILLRRRQLATTFNLSGSIGLSYTFGSIYNNVVNTRL